MNNAIVCLTRGYGTNAQYATLIKRNQSIGMYLNAEKKYPLIFFHEGNITAGQMQYIMQNSMGQDCEFVDVREVWVHGRGYESMCRFQTYHIWNYCKGFDAILRVDEDCMIMASPFTDPFTMLGDNVYVKSVYWGESHTETNATLPFALEKLTGADRSTFYNNKFPYTNVGLSRTDFWLEEKMNKLLKDIALCDDQIKNRWGDLPTLGSILNMFAKGRVGTLTGLIYKHESHNTTITCI